MGPPPTHQPPFVGYVFQTWILTTAQGCSAAFSCRGAVYAYGAAADTPASFCWVRFSDVDTNHSTGMFCCLLVSWRSVCIWGRRRHTSLLLFGICSVGNHDSWSLLVLVVGPQFVTLVLGLAMLLLGLVSHRGAWGLVSILYLVPCGWSLAAHCYQYWGYDGWVMALAPSPSPTTQPRPLLWVFLTRSCLNLTTGTALSLWLCLPQSAVLCPAEPHKKPALPPVKCQQNGFYYYQQPRIHRVPHRNHRKHKGKNGNETLFAPPLGLHPRPIGYSLRQQTGNLLQQLERLVLQRKQRTFLTLSPPVPLESSW
ncbi:Wnt-activated receptor activity protein [Homalodisca vitripennis]|nr:Wnt-activated receptor activity protein [Homalodisca vitripennis]